MKILRDRKQVALSDPSLRPLLDSCLAALAEFDDYDIELVRFVIVDPGDTLAAIDQQLGFPLMTRPHELLAEHDGWFEVVFVVSDDGVGIEVFIPKRPDVDPTLLDWCRWNALGATDE